MYIRPKKKLAGLLSTHIDSRSSSVPLCAQAPGVQLMPSAEVYNPIPCPPQPVARSPANQVERRAFHTTTGSPRLPPCPEHRGEAPAPPERVNVAPLSVE